MALLNVKILLLTFYIVSLVTHDLFCESANVNNGNVITYKSTKWHRTVYAHHFNEFRGPIMGFDMY